jgi:hypothetical protein
MKGLPNGLQEIAISERMKSSGNLPVQLMKDVQDYSGLKITTLTLQSGIPQIYFIITTHYILAEPHDLGKYKNLG